MRSEVWLLSFCLVESFIQPTEIGVKSGVATLEASSSFESSKDSFSELKWFWLINSGDSTRLDPPDTVRLEESNTRILSSYLTALLMASRTASRYYQSSYHLERKHIMKFMRRHYEWIISLFACFWLNQSKRLEVGSHGYVFISVNLKTSKSSSLSSSV